MVDRNKLDEIILKNEVKDWWIPELFIKNTKPIFPVELEILRDPPEEVKNHNCFAYALGFANKLELIAETRGFDGLYFIKLLENSELEKTDSPIDGDYVIYKDLKEYPDRLTHIGVLEGDKVISKWAWGPLVRHNLWDVPASYGNDVFYVKAISFENSMELYKKYKDSIEPIDPK
jgi:hypothetical protein